jgi:Domain of unknown function (DUF1772)
MNLVATGVRLPRARLGAALPAATVLTGLLAGAVLGTWLSEVSLGGSSELWIAYHQAVTPAYTRAVPPLGGLALIATLGALAAFWSNPRDRLLTLGATVCLLVGLVVTVVVHFPMNAEIATWQPATIFADRQQLQQRWLAAHALRTVAAVAGLVLLVAVGTRRRASSGLVEARPLAGEEAEE